MSRLAEQAPGVDKMERGASLEGGSILEERGSSARVRLIWGKSQIEGESIKLGIELENCD